MPASSSIPLYREINELHAAAGLALRTDLPEIHVFALDESTSISRGDLLPEHRRGFYGVSYHVAEHDPTGSDLIVAAAPEHVMASSDFLPSRDRGRRGFTLLFKAELIAHQLAAPGNEFPFFCLSSPARLSVDPAERGRLLPQFAQLHATFRADHAYRVRQLAALTTALLYDCRVVYEREPAHTSDSALCRALICRFEEVVRQHFPTHRTVEDYARLLHVSADHLSAEVKARTGRNARDIIDEHLVTEARHLLTYTELTVSQIADRLAFSEPTHFTRFFRRHTGVSPREFRRGDDLAGVARRELVTAAG